MLEENELALIEAVRNGDEQAFGALVEPLSRELRAYCYRMLGSFQDAEDALQEARLKAWRSLASYAAQASFRAWLYRIVTNTCLDLLRTRARRVLPQDVGPAVEPGPPSTELRTDVAWLEPYPDALLPDTRTPEAALLLKSSVQLAFIRAMQVLPPVQRAALILCDVLEWSSSDVAAMLETTVPAVNSALQRARVAAARPEGPSPDELLAHEARAVSRFVRAWESGDFEQFVALLSEDVVLSMPPWVYWLDGREAVVGTLFSHSTWQGEPRPGRYRVVPAPMNGQPALLSYVRGNDGVYVSVCLTVLTLDATGQISELTVFVLPDQLRAWGHPSTLE